MQAVFTIIIPLVASLLAYAVRKPAKKFVIILFAGLTAFSSLLALAGFLNSGAQEQGLFAVNGLSLIFSLIASLIGAIVVVYSLQYIKHREGYFFSLMFLFIASMNGLVFSNHVILFLAFWEMISLCSYGLIVFYKEKASARSAAAKAFIITHFGTMFLIVAMSWLAVESGTMTISRLGTAAPFFISFCFLIAALTKSAIFPFHVWLPDAMEAPTPASALLHSASMVNAGVFLIAKFYPLMNPVMPILLYVSLISFIVAAVYAFFEKNIKKMLAYSTTSHLSLMMIGLAIGTPLSISASLLHLINHATFKSLLFLNVGGIIVRFRTKNIDKIGNLIFLMPKTAILLTIGVASVIGIPPMNGFVSKWMLLDSFVLARNPVIFIGVLFGAIIMIACYLRFVNLVVFSEEVPKHKVREVPRQLILAMATLAFFCIALDLIAPAVLGFLVFPSAQTILPAQYVFLTKYGFWTAIISVVLIAAAFLLYHSMRKARSGAGAKYQIFEGGEKISEKALDVGIESFFSYVEAWFKPIRIPINEAYNAFARGISKFARRLHAAEAFAEKEFSAVTILVIAIIVAAMLVLQ